MKRPSHNTVPTYPPRLHLLPSVVPLRRTLSPRIGYAVAALVVGLGLFASATPSPLYRTYSVLWHFSPLTLTLIYATYAFGVLATLLLAGGVSDQVGRRPVLLAALGGLAGSTVLFLFADSAAWLFVARGLQGLPPGAALSAASAPLLDLLPRPAAHSGHVGPTDISLGVRRQRPRPARLLVPRPGRRAAAAPAVRGAPRPDRRRARRHLVHAGARGTTLALPADARAAPPPGRRA